MSDNLKVLEATDALAFPVITVLNDFFLSVIFNIRRYVVDSGYTNSYSVETFIVSENLS